MSQDSALNRSMEVTQIELLLVSSLIPYARNSRTHSDEQVTQIAASIREFGFTNPVLIDANGTIIAGHGRVLAAKKLGLIEVPCLRLGHLTPSQIRAYVIADNKIALNAGWDDEMLKAELLTLQEEGFNTDLTGCRLAHKPKRRQRNKTHLFFWNISNIIKVADKSFNTIFVLTRASVTHTMSIH